MTIDEIRGASNDDALYNLLARELEASLGPPEPIDIFLRELRALPRGLRAMGATGHLGVSLAIDSLGWHFGNWHDVELSQETYDGLRELEAYRMAELFQAAFHVAERYWDELGSRNWTDWYHNSPMEEAVKALDIEAWEVWEEQPQGILSYWLAYARKYPERVV